MAELNNAADADGPRALVLWAAEEDEDEDEDDEAEDVAAVAADDVVADEG